jgi:hypothetical protein
MSEWKKDMVAYMLRNAQPINWQKISTLTKKFAKEQLKEIETKQRGLNDTI